MKHFSQVRPQETSMKELWLASFTSLLARVTPEEAIKEADRALALCNEHWKLTDWAKNWQPRHSYPIGTEFEEDDDLRPAPRQPTIG